ncbi:MAG TPA: hypothetical protein VGI63_07135 [Verrucomicrobiae bacterium]
MEDIEILKERIRILENRIAELEESDAEMDDETRGLKLLKEKIVSSLKKNGEVTSIHSEKVHLLAIEFRDRMDKQAEEALERLRKRGYAKPSDKAK